MKWILYTFLLALSTSCASSDEKNKTNTEEEEKVLKEPTDSITSKDEKYYPNYPERVPVYDVNLPASGISEPSSEGFIDVMVNSKNQIRIGADDGPILDSLEIRAKLLEMSNELIESGETDQPIMKIHADKESNFETFSGLMTIAKEIDLKIVIATK